MLTRQEQIDTFPLYQKYAKWKRGYSNEDISDVSIDRELNVLETLRKKTLQERKKCKGKGKRLDFGLDFSLDSKKQILQNVKDVAHLILKSDYAPATKTSYLMPLRYYLIFKDINLDDEVTRLLKARRSRKGKRARKIEPEDVLSIEELDDIVAHTHSTALRAFWWVLYDTGSRPKELCQLKIKDVTEDNHGFWFHFTDVKNEHSNRTVNLLEPQAVEVFRQYWLIHTKRDNPNASMFINQRGNQFAPQSLIHIIRARHNKRLERGTGNGKSSLNLYLFRKSRTTQLLRDHNKYGLSLYELKLRLGHAPASTILEQYYAFLSKEDLKRAQLKAQGIVIEEEDTGPRTTICHICGSANYANAKRCIRCKKALEKKEIERELEEEIEKRILSMHKKDKLQIEALTQLVLQLSDKIGIDPSIYGFSMTEEPDHELEKLKIEHSQKREKK